MDENGYYFFLLKQKIREKAMPQLDPEIIKNLTMLSRIRCSKEERESLLSDLNEILGYVEQLNEVDVEGLPPCNTVLQGMTNVMREDETGQTLPRETFLANAPEHISGMVRVPPVIKSS